MRATLQLGQVYLQQATIMIDFSVFKYLIVLQFSIINFSQL